MFQSGSHDLAQHPFDNHKCYYGLVRVKLAVPLSLFIDIVHLIVHKIVINPRMGGS